MITINRTINGNNFEFQLTESEIEEEEEDTTEEENKEE